MIALTTALQAWIVARPTTAAEFPGGVWAGEAPETEAGSAAGTMPYLVTTAVTASPITHAYGGVRLSTAVTVQFAAYGTYDAAGAALESLANDLAAADLITLASGTLFDCLQVGEPRPLLMPDDGTGQNVWQWSVDFRFAVRL